MPSNLRDTTDLEQVTQEFRISSNTTGSVQWLVGLFYSDTYEVLLYINNLTDENADLSFDRERGGRARLGFRTNQLIVLADIVDHIE